MRMMYFITFHDLRDTVPNVELAMEQSPVWCAAWCIMCEYYLGQATTWHAEPYDRTKYRRWL